MIEATLVAEESLPPVCVEPPVCVTPPRSIELPPSLEPPSSLEPPPTLSVWGAFGWCLVLLLAEFVAGGVLGVLLFVSGLGPALFENRAGLLIVASLIGNVIMGVTSWNNLKPDATRKLAVRGIGTLHVLLIVMLVLPLAVLCDEIGNRMGDALDGLFASAGTFRAEAMVPKLPWAEVAYTGLFDDRFETIAQQPWIIMFVVGCLLPGICEELFFRGFLGRGLLARYGTVGGVVLTSLVFGLFHIDPVQASYTFVLGIVLHCVYLWTRSLWGPVTLHILFNLLGFSSHKLQLEGTLYFSGPGENLWIPLTLLGAALLAVLAILLVLRSSRVSFQSQEEAGSAWAPGYPTAGMPPASFVGSVRRARPAKWSLGVAAGAYWVFGLALAHAASVWFDPESALAHLNRGALHAEREEYEAAVREYTGAIEADSSLADAYRARGEAYRILGELQKALEDDHRAIALDPTSAWTYADRGETYRLLEMTDEALADCNRAIELDPKFGWAYSVRGDVYSNLGDSRRAIADFKRAVQLDPEHAWTHGALAWELVHASDEQLRDTQRALHHARKACELEDWSDPYMLDRLAAIYAAEGKFPQAVRYQRDALERAPDEARAEFQSQLEAYERSSVGGE